MLLNHHTTGAPINVFSSRDYTFTNLQHTLTDKYRLIFNLSQTLIGNKLITQMSALLQLHLHSRLNTWFHCLGKVSDKTRRESFKFCHLMRLILGILSKAICGTGAHFTNNYTIVIQIRWQFHSALIHDVMK